MKTNQSSITDINGQTHPNHTPADSMAFGSTELADLFDFETEGDPDFDFDDIQIAKGPELDSQTKITHSFVAVQKAKDCNPFRHLEILTHCKKTSAYSRSLEAGEYRDVCRVLF